MRYFGTVLFLEKHLCSHYSEGRLQIYTPSTSLKDEIIKLAWPILVSGLLGTIILFTDRLILGQYSPDTLASMQVIGPITWTAFSIFGSFGIGMLAVLGRAVGAKDNRKANGVLSASLLIALAAGVILGLAGLISKAFLTEMLMGDANPSKVVRDMATTYLTWTFCSAPFTTVAVILTFGFQASGDSKTPMWVSFLSGFVNLFLSWIFVFGLFGAPEWGISGAALGTASAAVVNCLLMGFLIQRPSRTVRLSKPDLGMLKPVFNVAFPTFLERLILHSGFLVYTGFVGRLGTAAMAAQQACLAIESLGFIASYALGNASGTIVAQKLGAQEADEAEQTIWYTMRFSLVLMTGIGAIFFFGAETFVGWFCTDPESLELGIACMKIASVAQPLMALCDCFAGSLRGAGDTKSPMLAALFGPVAVRITVCYLLAFVFELGLIGIWIGSTFDWATRAIWLFVVVRKGRWKLVEV